MRPIAFFTANAPKQESKIAMMGKRTKNDEKPIGRTKRENKKQSVEYEREKKRKREKQEHDAKKGKEGIDAILGRLDKVGVTAKDGNGLGSVIVPTYLLFVCEIETAGN